MGRTRDQRLLLAALIGLRLLVLGLVIYKLITLPVADADFHRFVQLGAMHGVPYRDHAVEYMPLELAAIFAVSHGGLVMTAVTVAVSSFFLELGVAWAIGLGWGLRTANRFLLLGLPLLTIMYWRLDFLPVLLTVLAFALTRRGRPRAGGLALGLAILTKIWPVFLLPVLLIERRRSALWWAIGSAAVGALAWLAVVGFAGIREVLTFRGATGFEVESTVGVLVWIAGGRLFTQAGATRVGRMPPGLGVPIAAASMALAGMIWNRARRLAGDLLGAPALGAVCALLAFSPLFSLQYMAWVVPWIAIAWPDEGARIPARLALAAVCVTGALFPVSTHASAATEQILLTVRNALVVAVVLWWFLPARSPGRVQAGAAAVSSESPSSDQGAGHAGP